jgi:hypothetical protein
VWTCTLPRACALVCRLLFYSTNFSLPLAEQSSKCLGAADTRDCYWIFSEIQGGCRTFDSVNNGGSTDLIDSGSFRTLNDGLLISTTAIFRAKLGAVALLLRMKTVGPLKNATCPVSRCANCVLMSGHDDAVTAAVMGASAPESLP